MVFTENGQVDVWSFDEAVKYKFFGIDRIDTQLPELRKIRDEMEALNKYKDADGAEIYKKKKTFFDCALKVLRVIFTICGDFRMIGTPIQAIRISVEKNAGIPGVILGWAVGWIIGGIDKLIVYAIDHNNEKEIISEVKEVLQKLEDLRDKITDEKTKEKLDRDIEKMQENLDRLQS